MCVCVRARVRASLPRTSDLWRGQGWVLRVISTPPAPRTAGSRGVSWLGLKFSEHPWKGQDQSQFSIWLLFVSHLW